MRYFLIIFSLIYSLSVFAASQLDAKNYLRKLDDPDSQYKFALCCYYGYGIEKDWQKAVHYLKKAVEKNHPQAQYFLGNCYLRGDGGYRNTVKAWELIKLAADNGCTDAQFQLGDGCRSGHMGKQDFSLAEKYLQKAAKSGSEDAKILLFFRDFWDMKSGISKFKQLYQGIVGNDAASQYNLAMFYLKNGGEKYKNKVLEYLQKAAKSGSEDAKILLFFRDFWDMKSGISKFKQLYQGIVGNDAASQYNLAMFYLKNGGEKYKNKVLEYLKKSADKNYTKAQYKLVQLYTDGTLFDKNYIEAEKYLLPLEKKRKFQKDANYTKFMLEFGIYFCRDVKNQQEFAKGVQYLKKAADKNSINALWMLLNYNLNGINMPVNYAEVFKYASILDKKGQDQAKLPLAMCYFGGLGVKADHKKGFDHIAAVAEKYPEAKLLLAECYRKGLGTEKDMKKAFDIYMQSAKAGNVKALFQVGLCYENCWGVKEYSQTMADKYFKLAADKGHVESMYRLGISKLKNYSYSYRHDSATDAFKYLQMAVANGCKKAYEKLGYCYEKGIGTARNFETALTCYRKFPDKLSADTLYQIGKYYQRNKNNQEYMKYLVDSADQGSKAAMEELGTNYYRGENGFEKNYLSAEKYYSALLKKTYPENMESILYNLAHCFKARGAVEEYEKTYARYSKIRSEREEKENARFKWLKEKASSYRAKDDANGNAAFELAQKYQTKLTIEERCKYLEIAASKGHERAKRELDFTKIFHREYFEKKKEEEVRRKNREWAEAERSYRRQQYQQEEEARQIKDAVRFQEKLDTLLDAVEIMDFMDNTLPKIIKERKSKGY